MLRKETNGSGAEHGSQSAGSIETRFDSLVDKAHKPLTDFLYRLMHDRFMVEGLAQETFVKAYRLWRTCPSGTEFTISLYRIAIAVARRHRGGTRFMLAAKAAKLVTSPQVASLLQPAAKIRQCVEELPEQQRVAVVLHKYQGLDCKNVAEVLEVSEPEAKSLLFCAYDTLRQKLKDALER